MAIPQSPKLSFLDRFLPVWIIMAMAVGLLIGHFLPGIGEALSALEVGGISLPIALGLLVMMYPPLAKVRYEKTRDIAADGRLMVVSIVLNWLVGPALMFTLAWIFLADQPELRTGLIIVGLARCIAMVLVWSDLSCADREATAVLVAINSVFQVAMFGVMGWFYLQVLPGWLGLDTTSADFFSGPSSRRFSYFWECHCCLVSSHGSGVRKPKAANGLKTASFRQYLPWR